MIERRLRRFNILLDDESLLYFPGSFLTGKVLLELDENTPVSGLFFHIIGEGVVKFNTNTKPKSTKLAPSDRENYIDFRMRLLGQGNEPEDDDDGDAQDSDDEPNDDTPAGNVLILSPGVHTFPFKLGLPASLPSTFLGLHGWVQYFCRAILKEPTGLIHKNQQVFIIINPIDLNTEPANLQLPFHCEAEEKINTAACSSNGLISCQVRLDRGGYVPGEDILISATIENSSKNLIKRTCAIITETVEYRAKNKFIQSETRELAAVEGSRVLPKSIDIWKKKRLHIPALPPTNLRGCHLIKIHYDVFFQIIVRGVKSPIKLQLPIVMATYPIRNSDGTLRRKRGASYPDSLPLVRPWIAGDNK